MDVETNVTQAQIEEYTRLGFWDRWTLCDYIKRWGAALPGKVAGAVSLSERWDNPIEEQYPAEYLDRNCRIDPNLALTMC